MKAFFLRLGIVVMLIFGCVENAGCVQSTNNQFMMMRAALREAAAEHHECPIENIRLVRLGRRENTFYVSVCGVIHLYEYRPDGSFIDITDTME